MSRSSLATPCPAPTSLHFLHRRSAGPPDVRTGDDTCTANIDYTRAIQYDFKRNQARRPTRFQKKIDKLPIVPVFAEPIREEGHASVQKRPLPGNTLLGRPAQKLGHGARKGQEKLAVQPLGEVGQARQRPLAAPSVVPTGVKSHGEGLVMDAADEMKDEQQRRHQRRRTIFVPSDNTTILTIHPGANMTDRLDDTFQPPSWNGQPLVSSPSFAPNPSMKNSKLTEKPRKALAVAPKRLPLQHVAPSFDNLPSNDVEGQNGGKENVPPSMTKFDVEGGERAKAVPSSTAYGRGPPSRSKLHEPTAASYARKTIVARKAAALPNVQRDLATVEARQQQRSRPKLHRQTPPRLRSPASQTITPRADSAPPVKPWRKTTLAKPVSPTVLSQYQVLSEDVKEPDLYEDSWLSHQEVALTEVINEIFHRTSPASQMWRAKGTSLRQVMLDIYHQGHVKTLHARLQASLMHGALSRPKASSSLPDPAVDLGLRKRFINLWLHAYDEQTLCAAVEVVVGRQLPRQSASNDLTASESVLDPAKSRRALIGFLEVFFVNVLDVETTEGSSGELGTIEGRRWRKMIVRSVMLIWLLDQTKQAGAVSGCLFKPTSSVKSSTTVLQALSSMLIPAIGDLIRVMRQFDYVVDQVQDPLDEVEYHIENIAVDLRDGIFLTRLVEILLFTSRHHDADVDRDGSATGTIPSATCSAHALHDSDGIMCSRILSQHLKMPCLGRAQKVYNVQVALSALEAQTGPSSTVAQDVTADNVVDGHREKTLHLLWSLVSVSGFGQLINRHHLLSQLCRSSFSSRTVGRASKESNEKLLQAWATAHCARYGVEVSNLTTSFAGGKAYAAILNAHSVFMAVEVGEEAATVQAPLEIQLRSLGCSPLFIKQLTAHDNVIPSRNTTISTLALLASRLLPLAHRHNAASLIQRAYRQRLARRLMAQRITRMRLARDCANVVQTQSKLTQAAIVIQRSWRAMLDAKISRLNGELRGFQSLARGWAVRRDKRTKAVHCVSATLCPVRVNEGWCFRASRSAGQSEGLQ